VNGVGFPLQANPREAYCLEPCLPLRSRLLDHLFVCQCIRQVCAQSFDGGAVHLDLFSLPAKIDTVHAVELRGTRAPPPSLVLYFNLRECAVDVRVGEIRIDDVLE